MSTFGASPKDMRRFSKAVAKARRDGVFEHLDNGYPVVLRSRVVDGLQDEIAKLFDDAGFDVVMVDASTIGAEDLSNPILHDAKVSLVFYGFGVGRVSRAVAEGVTSIIGEREDAIRDMVSEDENHAAHSMSMIIMHDRAADNGMAFSLYDNDEIS
jgi:hypothetical protein